MPVNWEKPFVLGKRASPAWVVFAGGAALAVLACVLADSRVHQHALGKAEVAARDAATAIQARIHSSLDVLYGVQGFFRGAEHVSREQFGRYVQSLELKERHPAIRSITYSEVVPGPEKAAFEARVRRHGAPPLPPYSSYKIKPEGDRPVYIPITYIEPLAPNQNAVGLDLFVGERRESVERARDTGGPVVSGRIKLSVDPAGEPAFSVRLALYGQGMPTDSVEARRAAFKGVVSATFFAHRLVEDVLTHPPVDALAARLYDRVTISGAEALGAGVTEYVLFERALPTPVSAEDSRFFQREIALDVGGRKWYLQFSGSVSDFVTPTDRLLPWLLLVGGLVVSALLAGLVGSLASSRERARRLAEQITVDLRRSEAKLTEAQRLTEAMIEALPNPIYFKGVDGRYRGVNQAWERFFGIRREAFIGKTVYALYPKDSVVAERLDALDQALWANPGSQTYEAVIPGADETRRDVLFYKATYGPSDGTVAGMIGTIIDITERKQAERRQSMEHAITRVLAEADSIAAAMPQIIRTICETMGWHYGDRYEFDPESAVLRRREYWAVDTPEMQAFAASAAHRTVRPDSSGKGLVRRAYAECAPVWIADISEQSTLRRMALVAEAGLHGAFAFPLVAGGQVLGVMEFFHRDVREPDAMLIQIAESIGSQIGQFIVRMQAEEAVKFVALHDALTQLPNRVMFNQRLEHAIAHAARSETRLAVMFIDLDRFKIINDTLGHEAGDLLLREVAQRITEHLRTGDMVARLGGDEFVVLLENLGDANAISKVAEKLIASLTSNFMIGGREVHVTASIGISTFPEDAQDLRSLLRYADIAMYRAKEQGRNTFQFYSDQIDVHSVDRLTLESQLRGALERNELVLHYQPVMDAKSGAVVAMEALVRWRRGDELLPPGKFIDLAEETGLIVPIGQWVLEAACAQQRAWRDLGLPPMRIAVNLSPRQFVHRHLVADIVRVIATTRCETGLLELEITESTVMHNAARAIAILGELKEMGIRIAIDDFGTGYSSLAHLKRFPIDCLKIDRSFVSEVPRDASSAAITQAIIAMAHSLGLKVTAEGVETLEQLQFLREHGCDDVQGYFLSVPLPAHVATAFVTTAAEQRRSKVVRLAY